MLATGEERGNSRCRRATVFHVQRASTQASRRTVVRIDGVPAGVALLAWEQENGICRRRGPDGRDKVVPLPESLRVQMLDVLSFATAVRISRWLDTVGDDARSLQLGPFAIAFVSSK